MHQQVLDFVQSVKERFPDSFAEKNVLELGSLDINGSVRGFFTGGEYIGVDLGEGPGVDVVSLAHEYTPPWEPDVIISTEMLEHDQFWLVSLQHAVKLLKPRGLMVVTCATVGRGEHGTLRSSPGDSPFTPRYYGNVSEEDFLVAVMPARYFNPWYLETGAPGDLRFYGVKRGV